MSLPSGSDIGLESSPIEQFIRSAGTSGGLHNVRPGGVRRLVRACFRCDLPQMFADTAEHYLGASASQSRHGTVAAANAELDDEATV